MVHGPPGKDFRGSVNWGKIYYFVVFLPVCAFFWGGSIAFSRFSKGSVTVTKTMLRNTALPGGQKEPRLHGGWGGLRHRNPRDTIAY